MLQGSNSFFETPKPQFVSSCVQVLDVDSENVKAPRISRNFSVQEKDVMLVDDLWWLWWWAWSIFYDLWWVNQINDYMLISLISLRDGLGRCLFFQICFLWNVVDMVPDMDGYRSTLFRIPKGQELDQWNFRTPSSVEKIWEELSFLQIIPENNRLDSLKLKWPESWFPESWDVGHGYVKLSTIYQPSGDMLVYPGCFFFIRSWQALVSFDQSFFGLFFFVWPVWRGLSCAKNPAKGIDWRVRLPSEENHGNLFSRKSEKTDLSVTRLWQHLVWNIYIYIYLHMYIILCMFLGYPTKKSNSLESLQYGAFNL